MTRLVNRLTQLSGALFYFFTFRREKKWRCVAVRPSESNGRVDRLGWVVKARLSLCEKRNDFFLLAAYFDFFYLLWLLFFTFVYKEYWVKSHDSLVLDESDLTRSRRILISFPFLVPRDSAVTETGRYQSSFRRWSLCPYESDHLDLDVGDGVYRTVTVLDWMDCIFHFIFIYSFFFFCPCR